MTITPFEVYLLLKLDTFQLALGLFGGLGMLVSIFLVISSLLEEKFSIGATIFLTFIPLFSLVLVISAFALPSTKQVAVIYAAPKILNSEFVQKDVSDEAKEIYGLVKEWLSNQTEAKGK